MDEPNEQPETHVNQQPADDDYQFDMELSDQMPSPPPKPAKNKKKLLLLVGIVLLCAGGTTWAIYSRNGGDKQTNNQQSDQATREQKTSLRLIATGDNIPHDAINQAAKQADGTYEYDAMFGATKKWFERADVHFCNQPTLAGGEQFGITGYPIFNAPTSFSKSLSNIGCNVINVGSNHTFDKSQDVITATLDGWKDTPGLLAIAGANRSEEEKNAVRYFENNGVKFAFVSYTTYSNTKPKNSYGVTMYSDELASMQIKEADSKADIVLVSMRWGTEYSVTANGAQRTLASKLAKLGADVVLGHGPHVVQPYEEVEGIDGKKTLVWYSLGNYLNAQLEPETLFNGIAVMDISVADKTVKTIGYLPVYMHYEWSAAEKAREDLLARKNFSMYTFDEAGQHLENSQLDTTIEIQTARLQDTLNTYEEVKILTIDDYLSN